MVAASTSSHRSVALDASLSDVLAIRPHSGTILAPWHFPQRQHINNTRPPRHLFPFRIPLLRRSSFYISVLPRIRILYLLRPLAVDLGIPCFGRADCGTSARFRVSWTRSKVPSWLPLCGCRSCRTWRSRCRGLDCVCVTRPPSPRNETTALRRMSPNRSIREAMYEYAKRCFLW